MMWISVWKILIVGLLSAKQKKINAASNEISTQLNVLFIIINSLENYSMAFEIGNNVCGEGYLYNTEINCS